MCQTCTAYSIAAYYRQGLFYGIWILCRWACAGAASGYGSTGRNSTHTFKEQPFTEDPWYVYRFRLYFAQSSYGEAGCVRNRCGCIGGSTYCRKAEQNASAAWKSCGICAEWPVFRWLFWEKQWKYSCGIWYAYLESALYPIGRHSGAYGGSAFPWSGACAGRERRRTVFLQRDHRTGREISAGGRMADVWDRLWSGRVRPGDHESKWFC